MKAGAGGIHIGTGLQDRLGNIAQNSLLRVAALRAAGVEVAEYNVNGVHTWDVWRQMLDNYLRNMAFRATTTSLDVETAQLARSSRVKVTATATVGSVTTGGVSPSGPVDFYAGDVHLGSAPVRNGVARLHQIVGGALGGPVVAHYRGDKLFNGSRSASVETAG